MRKMAECLSDSDRFVEEIEPEVEEYDSTSSCSSVHVPSLLSRLKSSAPSDQSRKRKLKTNPPKDMKHGKGAVTAEPFIHPTTRIRKSRNENLSDVAKKLFCDDCREPVSVKKSVLLKSTKHAIIG